MVLLTLQALHEDVEAYRQQGGLLLQVVRLTLTIHVDVVQELTKDAVLAHVL